MNIIEKFWDWCKNKCFSLFHCTREQPMFCASMVIIIVAIAILVHYFYMAIFPLKIMDINNATVKDKVVHPGDILELELDWCSYGQHPVKINRRMVDGFVFTLPTSESTTPPKGCYDSHIRNIQIPEITPDGEYYLQFELIIEANSVRQVIKTFETNKFTVVTE